MAANQLKNRDAGALLADATNGTHERRVVRVLVVEDDEDCRRLTQFVFARAGFNCVAADSVDAAMRLLDAFSPDVIISDIGLPNEDGYSFIRRLRDSDARAAFVPAIALTAFRGDEARRRAGAAGFDLFMTKPVEPANLLTAVRDLLACLEDDYPEAG